MNLVIDIGNSRSKTAIFDGHQLVSQAFFTNQKDLLKSVASASFDHCLISSVGPYAGNLISSLKNTGEKILLTSSLDLPIKISYDTPKTLGVDRIAAACGALELFPSTPCLVIDMGTCITYDFLSAEGAFEGGAIAPGVRMRFKAMNRFTARLPLVETATNPPLTGKSTTASMQSGVINGVLGEINEFISRYQSLYPNIRAVVCGGDSVLFENSLKPSIFVAPDLVLIGLNRILLHHVNY